MKPEEHYSVEQQLLLALLGRGRESRDRAEMLSVIRQVDWREFLNTASEDLYPYVAFGLEPHLSSLETPPEWERLFKARRLTAVHNLLLRHELGKALEALSHSGIPALALKGVVLAYTAYPEPSLRPMSDLDLLVPPGRREEALQVLRTLGYEYQEYVLAIHRMHISRLGPGQEFAPPLHLRASSVLLEVHSQLECCEPAFAMPLQEFWLRSIRVDFRGLSVPTLCPEDFLFHLCLHQSRSHRFEKGLLPLVDLKLLLDSRQDWNWASIAERSLRSGCATWMYLTLRIARDLVSASIPDSFFLSLPRPRDLARLGRLVEEQIWSAQSGRPVVPPFLGGLLAELSWRSRARVLLGRMRLVERGELDSEQTLASLVEWARLFFRRLLATFRTRVPVYIHAARSGHLKLRTIRETAARLRVSNTMFMLIEQETRQADKSSLTESGSRAFLKNSTDHARPIRRD